MISVVYPVIVYTCSDSTGQPSSPAATPVPVVLPVTIVIIFMVVVIRYTVIMVVTVVCRRWKPNHGRYRIAAGEGMQKLTDYCHGSYTFRIHL